MMKKAQAEEMAKVILQKIVDALANRDYAKLDTLTQMDTLTSAQVQELLEGYLALNALTHIDHFGHKCNRSNPLNQQSNFYHYTDGSGFALDYDLTTEGVLNDLTLQMEFFYDDENALKAHLLDLHVL